MQILKQKNYICFTLEPPATNNSLIGIVAGVVGGVVFLIIVVIIVVCCLKKKRSKSTKPRHSIGNESNGYIDAKDIDNIPRVVSKIEKI